MNNKTSQKIINQIKDDYNRIAPQFDSTRKHNWRDVAKVVKDLKITKGAKVLDLGCGSGRLYELLEEYHPKYTGLDISEELIGLAQRKYPGGKFEVADLTNIKVKNKYDFIFSIAAVHHIPSKTLRDKVISDIKNSLNSGGTAIVTAWYFWNQPKFFNKILSDFFSFKNRSLPFGDFYVPWKNQKGEILAQRYHHAWTAHELKKHGFKILAKKPNLIGIFTNK